MGVWGTVVSLIEKVGLRWVGLKEQRWIAALPALGGWSRESIAAALTAPRCRRGAALFGMKYPQTTVECAVELSSLWSRHERLHNGDGMLKNVLIEAEDRIQRLDINNAASHD